MKVSFAVLKDCRSKEDQLSTRREKAAKDECGARSQALIKALAHPARVHALHILNQREASPKELAYETGTPIGRMAYHLRVLKEAGFVELVREEQRRGATEHFYKGSARAVFREEEWILIPQPIRAAIVGMELEATGRLLSRSLGSGIFERRPSRHHSLHECVVDEQGWDETMEVLRHAMERISDIQAESAERRLRTEEPGIRLAVSMLGFEQAPR